MRPPRPPGGAVRSHLPLGAMNRAGSPFGELGERGRPKVGVYQNWSEIKRLCDEEDAGPRSVDPRES